MFSSSRSRALSKSPPSIAVFDPKWWKIALALFLALLLQTTCLPKLAIHEAIPSLTLLLIAWYAMNAGPARGMYFGLLVGACEDALAVTGSAWTFADATTGAFAGAVARALPYNSVFLTAPIVAPLTIARYVVFLFTLNIQHQAEYLAAAHWNIVLWQSMLNVLTALLIIGISSRSDLFDVEH